MRINKYTGVVQIPVKDLGDVSIQFTWGRISELQSRFGDEWERKFNEAVQSSNVETIAYLLSVASDKDEGWWLEASPPLVDVCEALSNAMVWSFMGPKGVEDLESEDPLKALPALTRLWRALKVGSGLGGKPQSSGT